MGEAPSDSLFKYSLAAPLTSHQQTWFAAWTPVNDEFFRSSLCRGSLCRHFCTNKLRALLRSLAVQLLLAAHTSFLDILGPGFGSLGQGAGIHTQIGSKGDVMSLNHFDARKQLRFLLVWFSPAFRHGLQMSRCELRVVCRKDGWASFERGTFCARKLEVSID